MEIAWRSFIVRVERPFGNLNSSDDLFGKTWAGPARRGLMRRRDAGWGGEREREREPKRTGEMGGAEDRLLLRTGRRGASEEEGRPRAAAAADIIPPAE